MGCSAVVVNNSQTNAEQPTAYAINSEPQTRSEGHRVSPDSASSTANRESLSGLWTTIRGGRNHCSNCAVSTASERLVNAARTGRIAARSPEARARHAESERRHANARSSWDKSNQPAWLTSEVFAHKIQPLLADVSTAALRAQIGVSRWYAGRIRHGYRPHPRHWVGLAQLVGTISQQQTRAVAR